MHIHFKHYLLRSLLLIASLAPAPLIMELLSHCKTPSLPSLLSSHSASSQYANALLLPGYGDLKACSSHGFFIKAVLEARPAEQKRRLLKGEGGPALKRIENAEELQMGVEERRTPLKLQRKDEMGMEDGEAESTWEHRLWVAAGNVAIVGVMVKAMEAYKGTSQETLGVLASAFGGYILADFATGLYHWAIDNYGNAHTPLFGTHIDAFQAHHKRPWVISTGHFANNIHRQARPAAFILTPFLLMPSHPFLHTFLAIFTPCVVYSQQFHAWVHAKKKDVPAPIIALQDMGLLLPRKMHGIHHRPPYNVNYCIVSGLCNPLLDHLQFFATLEKLIFITCHARPRSWVETSTDWLQNGSYFADGSDMDDVSSP